ncbi:hypothetical protein [Streptosporangium vulgare]|uniref:ABC transporter permease n=1 Tax=Streptosporangium vulgare TaxID=46190 RepID=UPI0031DB5EB6
MRWPSCSPWPAAAVLAPWTVPGATDQDLVLGITGPVPGHPLGTDDLGRDVLELLVAGARTAVPGALCVAVGSMLIGNLIGLPAGYFGGWADALAMRWADLMFSLPALLVAIVVAGVLGGGYGLAVARCSSCCSPPRTRGWCAGPCSNSGTAPTSRPHCSRTSPRGGS